MPRSDSVGPEVIALGGVVVDHVENHLDAGAVQRPHHRLNSRTASVAAMRDADSRMSGAKIRQRVVAPVVRQPAFDQVPVVGVMVHRHQFDGGDAELLQMLDRRLRRQRLDRCRAAAPGRRGCSFVNPLTCIS